MSKSIGLKHIKIVVGEDYAHFQNWVRRQYFSLTAIAPPTQRGAWHFSERQALEVALVASLARATDDWKTVRRRARELFPKLEDGTYDGAYLNLDNDAVRWLDRDETNISPFRVGEFLKQPQSGWAGDVDPAIFRPTALFFLDFDSMRERVAAAFSVAAQDEALLS